MTLIRSRKRRACGQSLPCYIPPTCSVLAESHCTSSYEGHRSGSSRSVHAESWPEAWRCAVALWGGAVGWRCGVRLWGEAVALCCGAVGWRCGVALWGESSKWLKPLRSRRTVPACDTCASRSRSCRSRAQQPRRSSRLRLLNPQRTGSDFLAATERGDEEGRTPASGAGAHPPDEKSLRQNSFVKWTRSQTSPNHKSDLPTP